MRLYIAGPMTGKRQFNIPAFDGAAELLRADGHDVVSPVELDGEAYREWAMLSEDGVSMEGNPNGWTWGHVLARDIELITDGGIELVVVIDGWAQSRGARLETFVANAMNGLPVYEFLPHRDVTGPLVPVSRIALFRAWTGEPALSIHHTYGVSS